MRAASVDPSAGVGVRDDALDCCALFLLHHYSVRPLDRTVIGAETGIEWY
jgi:hypothetical protein